MKTSIFSTVRSFAAFFVAGLAFAACSSDNSLVEEPQPVQQPSQSGSVYTVTVSATKGGETRALAIDGSDISATWTAGDAVTVYNVTKEAELSGSLLAQSDGEATILKGELTGTIENGDELKLKYLSPSYSTQNGTLDYIAANCDYAEAAVTVSAISGSNIATTDATFENKQAIVKFTLKDKANDATISASELKVNAGGTTYTVTPASATSELYVAVPAISSQKVNLSATVGDDTYIYEKDGITFEAGKYYPIAVKMTKYNANSTPLTFEAKTAGAIVTFTAATSGVTITPIEYNKYDGAGWQTYESPVTLTNVGDKVSFRGTNDKYGNSANYSSSKFSCSDDCYIYGNIMSLIDDTNFATNTTLTDTYTFAYMFYQNTKVFNHSGKELVLPATTLADFCYYHLFYGCSALTTAPELPATTLAESCYNNMFHGCTGLTTAPELPATTLANRCYTNMFYGCSALTTAPELPTTTLTVACYSYMFARCTSLTTAPKLPATTLAGSCYNNMFLGCTGLTAAPELPATTLSNQCYDRMFSECSNLTTAPELPATTLAETCYSSMFNNCTSLITAPELPATTLAEKCYQNMFAECTSLTIAPALPATTLKSKCYNQMFIACTNLTTAPDLPATTLVTDCYSLMFYGCTSLTNVKCLATDISAACTSSWLDGVSASGTFIKAAGVDWSGKTGSSGIPSGWTVLEE